MAVKRKGPVGKWVPRRRAPMPNAIPFDSSSDNDSSDYSPSTSATTELERIIRTYLFSEGEMLKSDRIEQTVGGLTFNNMFISLCDRIFNSETVLNGKLLRMLLYGIMLTNDEEVPFYIINLFRTHLKNHPPHEGELNKEYASVLMDKIPTAEPVKKPLCLRFWNLIVEMNPLLLAEKEEEEKKKNVRDEFNKAKEEFDKAAERFKEDQINKDKVQSENIDGLLDKQNSAAELMILNCRKTLEMAEKELANAMDFKLNKPDIPVELKLDRYFLVFRLYLTLLEMDYLHWESKPSNYQRPLILQLIVDNDSYFHDVVEMFCNASDARKSLPGELIALIAQVTRKRKDVNVGVNISGLRQKFVQAFGRGVLGNALHSEEESLRMIECIQMLKPRWVLELLVKGIMERYLGTSDLKKVKKVISDRVTEKGEGPSTSKAVKKTDKKRKISRPVSRIKQIQARKNQLCNYLLKTVNERNIYGENILHRLCRRNEAQKIEKYLKLPKVNINVQDNFGWTPLHLAAKYKSYECAKLIFKYRAPPILGAKRLKLDLAAGNGVLPIMDAVAAGDLRITQLLLMNGARKGLLKKRDTGINTLDIAKRNGSPEMEALISGCFAKVVLKQCNQ